MKVFIDLFAGLGGASEAFYRDPTWQVMRIDNNEALLEHTSGLIVADITDFDATCAIIKALMPESVEKLVIWSSPPCLEFSQAYSAPKSIAHRDGIDFEPSMNCLLASIDIIEAFKPDHWYVENVRGAIIPFTEELGMPYRQQIGSFFLWGSFPLIALASSGIRGIRKKDSRWSPIRANIKAKVPFEYSQAIFSSIEHQTTLQFDGD